MDGKAPIEALTLCRANPIPETECRYIYAQVAAHL